MGGPTSDGPSHGENSLHIAHFDGPKGDYIQMTVAPLSLALVAQAPMGPLRITTTEDIVVVCIMLSLLLVAIWMRWGSQR